MLTFEGPSFDLLAIDQHVSTLFDLAQGKAGKFVVVALSGDKSDSSLLHRTLPC